MNTPYLDRHRASQWLSQISNQVCRMPMALVLITAPEFLFYKSYTYLNQALFLYLVRTAKLTSLCSPFLGCGTRPNSFPLTVAYARAAPFSTDHIITQMANLDREVEESLLCRIWSALSLGSPCFWSPLIFWVAEVRETLQLKWLKKELEIIEYLCLLHSTERSSDEYSVEAQQNEMDPVS